MLKHIRFFSILILFLSNFVVWQAILREESRGKLTVSFLDVGQGDAIFIEAPNGNQVLVDGGPDRGVIRALSDVMPHYDRTIDVILATHPDKDHIGGFSEILNRYRVLNIVTNGSSSDTLAYKSFSVLSEKEGARLLTARRGMKIDLGNEVFIKILFPEHDVSNLRDTNEGSIVAELVYGRRSFILTGDASVNIERRLVSLEGKNLKTDVLKLGHHGSKTSSSELFLGFTDPDYAIVSAGCENRYGHPHKEVTERLMRLKIPQLSTCENGTITFKTDGRSLELKARR